MNDNNSASDICINYLFLQSYQTVTLSLPRLSMIEPGPVHTEFETKMMEEVAKMEYPGADADTVRYFKDVYLPSSIDIFQAMGQTPDDIANVCVSLYQFEKSVTCSLKALQAVMLQRFNPCIYLCILIYEMYFYNELNECPPFQCVKKVVESSRPRFRNLTNSLYTPIVAMKYADETGGLSVHAFYNLLFNFGSLMHFTMSLLKCLTCSCLRRRTISPD